MINVKLDSNNIQKVNSVLLRPNFFTILPKSAIQKQPQLKSILGPAPTLSISLMGGVKELPTLHANKKE